MVFAGLYPLENNDYLLLRDALERLRLNDASLVYEPETSSALGFGFRCGFLGSLHMEIVWERLEREYNLSILATAPSVAYQVMTRDGKELVVTNPSALPPEGEIGEMREPWMKVSIICPPAYIGTAMELARERRGEYTRMEYVEGTKGEGRVILEYDMPLKEIIFDFYDNLKSRTQGYASMDYTLSDYRAARLVKLDILVNNQPVDALSLIVHADEANQRGRELVERLRGLVPRQLFDVPIQAAIRQRVIVRETIKALRKNVTAKCYGGDITRKRKLLQKQAEGKRKMKRIGNVDVPREAFMAVLKLGR